MTSAQDRSEAETQARASKDEAILVLLSRLALVYWRPDFSPGQARQLYVQYLEDLNRYALSDIDGAIKKYRRDPANKFFPVPGQLRGLIEAIPSWDVISRNDHIRNLVERAKDELRQVMATLPGPVRVTKNIAQGAASQC